MEAARSLLLLLVAVGLAASEHAAEGGGFLAGQVVRPGASEGPAAPEQLYYRRGNSHVTHESYGGQVKSAAGAAIGGVVLVLLAFPVIWFNERREVHMEQVFGYARKIMKEVGSEKVDGSNEGCLVSMQGVTATKERLTDPVFDVGFSNCAKIKRDVEMYQWVESSTTEERDTPGGGKDKITTYSYDMQWVGTHHDSSTFHDTSYQNPPFPFEDREQVATSVTLGAFSLTKKLISQMVDWRAAQGLPPKCQAAGRPFLQQGGGGVYVTNPGGSPQVGDMRVTFKKVECGSATVLALQHGSSFVELSYAMVPKGCSCPWSPPPAKVDLSQPLLGKGEGSPPMNPCACIGSFIQSQEELNELAEAHLSAGEMMGRAEGKQKCIHLGLLTLGYFMFFIGFLLQFQFVPTLFRIIPWVGTWIQYFGNAIAFVGAFFCGCFWWSSTLAFSWVFSRPIRAVLLFSFAIAMVAVPTLVSQGH